MTQHAEQAAQVIVELINSKPQSPTAAEIAAVIAAWTSPSPWPAAAPSSDRSGAIAAEEPPIDESSLAFQAYPITFKETNKEFADRWLPWVRMAFVSMLQQDYLEAREWVRGAHVSHPQGGDEFLDQLDEGWECAAERFKALGEFMSSAQARLLIARAYVDYNERGK